EFGVVGVKHAGDAEVVGEQDELLNLPGVITFVARQPAHSRPFEIDTTRVEKGKGRGIARQATEEAWQGGVAITRFSDDHSPMMRIVLGDARTNRGDVGVV